MLHKNDAAFFHAVLHAEAKAISDKVLAAIKAGGVPERGLRTDAARIFAAAHGLTDTKSFFGVKGLRSGGWRGGDLPPCCDHTWYFSKDRRPEAIVTFPYHVDMDVCEAFAIEHELEVTLSQWPNWYYPGMTKMVVWRSAGLDWLAKFRADHPGREIID